MSSKQLLQEEESWLRYPQPHTSTDSNSQFNFQKQPSFGHPQDQKHTPATFDGYLQSNKQQHLDASSTNNKRPLSTEYNASSFHLSTDCGSNHTSSNNNNINNINGNSRGFHAFSPSGPSPASASFTSSSSPTGLQPRTLSEELAMALQQQQQQPENNNSHSNDTGYPSPTTPSGLLWSPADLSMPSSSSSSFSSSSSSHFPLFKPRLCDTSSSTGQQGHSHSRHNPNINYNYRSNPEDATAQPHQQQRKPRPSPLALYANPTGGPSSHYRATGSSTSAVSCDTTTAHDIVGSPQSAMATATASAASFGYMGASHPSHSHSHPHHNQHQYAGATSPLSRFHHLSNNNNNNNSNKHGSNHGYHGNHSNHRYSLQGPPPSNPSSLMHHRASSLSLSSASSSSYSTISSPSSSSPCFCHSKGTGHRPGCHKLSSSHLSSAQQHHPACQHHTHFVSISTTTSTAATNTSPPPQQVSFLQPLQQQQQQQQAQYAAKFGRATKGVSRFGTPHFTPEFDPSDASYTASFSRSNRRGVSGENNGYGRPRDFDDDAMDVDDSSYASEPPKKKQRSTASILLGAAVETVIFTGAVALSAYQLLTGMGKLSTSSSANHSKQGSTASDVANAAEPQDNVTPASEAMQEDEKSVKKNTPTPRPRAHYSSGSLGRTARGSYYHKAKTSRSFRARQSLSGTHNFSHAAGFHARSSSMPVRPNTGTEDTDEAFLRMEAQLSNLIAEGKRALSSRIEVWDEE